MNGFNSRAAGKKSAIRALDSRGTLLACMIGVFAFALSGQDKCQDLLQGGIWDYQTTSASIQTSSFLTWFCKNQFLNLKDASDRGLPLGLPAGDLPLSVGAFARDRQWADYRNEMCRTSSGQYVHAPEFSAFSKIATAMATPVWEQCMDTSGTLAFVQTTQDPNTFAVQIRRHIETGLPIFTVQDIVVTNGALTCTPTLASAKNKPYVGSASFLCQRQNIEDGFAILPTVAGTTPAVPELAVPGYKELPPAPQTPPFVTKIFHGTSAAAERPELDVKVEAGYKVIGCGARVNWKAAGSLLTALYPDQASHSCIAKAKDQDYPDPATIQVFAIGLEDPNDLWDVKVFSSSSPVNSHPIGDVSVPAEYAMVGGGAQVNWSGTGNILTASYPLSTHTWAARGKDHIHADPASLTVYAVGVKPKNNAPLPRVQIFSATSDRSPRPLQIVRFGSASDFALTSGGAMVDWRGAGNFLTASFPNGDGTGWIAEAKDHEVSDPSSLTVWAIGVKKATAPVLAPELMKVFESH